MNGNDDQPIHELADLESPVSTGFLQRFRQKIYRRAATAQFAQFSYAMPLAIFIEFIGIIVHLVSVVDGKKGRSSR